MPLNRREPLGKWKSEGYFRSRTKNESLGRCAPPKIKLSRKNVSCVCIVQFRALHVLVNTFAFKRNFLYKSPKVPSFVSTSYFPPRRDFDHKVKPLPKFTKSRTNIFPQWSQILANLARLKDSSDKFAACRALLAGDVEPRLHMGDAAFAARHKIEPNLSHAGHGKFSPAAMTHE